MSLFTERISFDVAINDPFLLKAQFDDFTLEQQTLLRTIYGLPLKTEAELKCWSILQGRCEYDHLGYPTKVYDWPYVPREYNRVWSILGRRGGKSTLASFIVAYEATLGGHLEYTKPGQEVVIYYVAQIKSVAEAQLKTIHSILLDSEVLASMIERDPSVDEIRLVNGIKIIATPPSVRARRGLSVPVAVLDESGFWFSDADSASPDVGVEDSIKYSQQQFPHYKRIGISTPWTKEGLLWKYYNAGTNGERLANKSGFDGVLVHYATTAAMGTLAKILKSKDKEKKVLENLLEEDGLIFERESLAKFIDSISGFLPEALIKSCVTPGVKLRNPELSKYTYIAAMDPAWRHDAFAFVICHKDEKDVINVDVILKWKPEKGTKLNPSMVLDELKPWINTYGVGVLHSDQYHLETIQQLAADRGIVVNGLDFTKSSKPRIMGDLENIFRTHSISLLDPELSLATRELIQELMSLEKVSLPSGSVRIAARQGKYDDLAMALALCAHMALHYDVKPQEYIKREPTLLDRYKTMLEERKESMASPWD